MMFVFMINKILKLNLTVSSSFAIYNPHGYFDVLHVTCLELFNKQIENISLNLLTNLSIMINI